VPQTSTVWFYCRAVYYGCHISLEIVGIIIIIIISHLLHENKSQVLTIQMADMQMEQARSYELIQGLVPRAG